MAMSYNWSINFHTNANFLLDRSMLHLQVHTPSKNGKGFACCGGMEKTMEATTRTRARLRVEGR